MKYTFDEYRSIRDAAVAKYEREPFFEKLIAAHGRPAFPEDRKEVITFGIRHEGKTVNFRENTADDTISLVRLNSDGFEEVHEYAGTTESGLFKQVINPLGDFKMLPGFYFFKHGLHHGKNPCLVQAGPVTGERARKGQDFDETDDRTWEINDGSLHIHAGILNVDNVGSWSAGCQVIAGGWDGSPWKEFYRCCREAPNNRRIPYILVNESDIPGLLG